MTPSVSRVFTRLNSGRWITPTLEKLHRLTKLPGGTHHESLSENDIRFGSNRIDFGISCWGDTLWDSVLLSQVFDRKWLQELDEKVQKENLNGTA